MKKIQLFRLMKKIDSLELKKLEEMVYSPFFNKDKKCIALFEALKRFAPNYELTEEDKQRIANEIFPGRKWNDASFSFLRSKLLDLIKKLLIQQELEERKNYKSHLLIKALIKHDNSNYARSIYNQTQKNNVYQSKTDIDFYYEQYLLEENNVELMEKEQGRNSKEHMVDLMQSLDTYFIARKMNLSVEMLSLKNITGLDYEDIVLTNIEHIVSHPQYQENSFIQIYYYILQFLNNEDNEDAYHQFIDLLNSPLSRSFYKTDINIFLTHAANYCARRIKSGKSEFKVNLFAIYQAMISYRLIYDGNYIRVNRMKNIISLACQLGKTEWAKEFLDIYQKDLPPQSKESASKMFNAFICFYEKDFKGTLSQLAQIQIDIDILYFLNTRTFQLRCYYELSESNAFYSLNNTFRDYLRRTKKEISKSKKTSHRNFNKIAYMLYRKKEGFSKKAILDIHNKIETTKPLELKTWLLEKCEELK